MAAGGDYEEECVSQGSTANAIDSWLPKNLREQLAILEVMLDSQQFF